jgi:predicted small secreted protein
MFKDYLFILAILFGLLVYSSVIAEEPKYQSQATPEVLEHFVNLEGEWIGTHINHDGEEEKVDLVYRTVSGGTAVEERIFADTPKEMVTMYHGDGNDGILMTHYCMLGNQPRLKLEITDGKAFDFKFLDGAGIDRKKTGHMGGMKMTILDENTFEQEWAYFEEGEVKNSSKFTFTRK